MGRGLNYPKDNFYEVENNMIMCGECINDWKLQTERGILVGDEVYKRGYVHDRVNYPAQCDGCLKQTEDYDSLLDEDCP